MPIPIIAAGAIGAGSAILAGGGAGIYYSTKYKKEIAELQEELRRLQVEMKKRYDREKELIDKIAEIEKQKLDLVSKIELLTIENKSNIERLASFEESLKRNDTKLKKIVSVLSLKLEKFEKDNEFLREQIKQLTDMDQYNIEMSQNMEGKIVELDSVRKHTLDDLKFVQSEIND